MILRKLCWWSIYTFNYLFVGVLKQCSLFVEVFMFCCFTPLNNRGSTWLFKSDRQRNFKLVKMYVYWTQNNNLLKFLPSSSQCLVNASFSSNRFGFVWMGNCKTTCCVSNVACLDNAKHLLSNCFFTKLQNIVIAVWLSRYRSIYATINEILLIAHR